jgi:hypothetical protein
LGRPFTEETVAAAYAEYESLESLLKDRMRVKKAIYEEYYSAMKAAWEQERKRRDLPETSGLPSKPMSGKRDRSREANPAIGVIQDGSDHERKKL